VLDHGRLYMRRIENFVPRASQSPKEDFWKNVRGELDMIPGTWMEKEKKLPYHPVYVYSSQFLASVMLLVYEVLYPKPLVHYVASSQVAAKLILVACSETTEPYKKMAFF
jgi:hypothetical protein